MRTLIAVAAVCLVTAAAFAELVEIGDGSVGDIRNILELQSDDPATRDSAEKALIANADAAAEQLRSLAINTDDADLQKRIDHILQFAGGGEVVDGLRVRLSVDKEAVRPGDVVTITTTLMNLTDKPLQVEVGYTTTGNYFESGSALAASFTTGSTGEAAPLRPQWTVGFCGTGATNIVHTIEPMSTVSYASKATYGEVKNQFAPAPEPVDGVKPKLPTGLAFQYSYLPLSANGTLSLTVERQNADLRPKVQPKPAPAIKGEPGKPQPQLLIAPMLGPAPKVDLDKPFWHGTMKSNTVELKVFTQQVG